MVANKWGWKSPNDLALDTETTGLSVAQGHKPYTVSISRWTTPTKIVTDVFEWEVEILRPKLPTAFARPIPRAADVREIRKLCKNAKRVIMWNAPFDQPMMGVIGVEIPWAKIDDAMGAAQIIDSSLSKKLKFRAEFHLGIRDKDRTDLEKMVVDARRLHRKMGYSVEQWETLQNFWLPKYCFDNYGKCPKGWATANKKYAGLDAERTLRLDAVFLEALQTRNPEWLAIYERERQLLPVVHEMRQAGVPLRMDVLKEKSEHLHAEADRLEKSLRTYAGKYNPQYIRQELPPPVEPVEDDPENDPIGARLVKEGLIKKKKIKRVPKIKPLANLNTSNDLRKLLFDLMKIPCLRRTPTGLAKMDDDTLDGILNTTKNLAKGKATFVENLKAFRSVEKMIGYCDDYLKRAWRDERTGEPIGWKLFPSAWQWGTRTTRFSYSNPNLQNVPKNDEDDATLRKVFGSDDPEWVWVTMDYSQVEIRIFAAYSGDEFLQAALDADQDIHSAVAAELLGIPIEEVNKTQRRRAKTVNFGIIYGMGAPKLAIQTGDPTLYPRFKARFTKLISCMQRTIQHAKKHLRVETLFGTPLTVSPDQSYAGLNYVIQGTAGDIIKNAMLHINQELRARKWDHLVKPMLMVHDEMNFMIHRSRLNETTLAVLRGCMEKAGSVLGLKTPVEVEVCDPSWGEGRKIDFVRTRGVRFMVKPQTKADLAAASLARCESLNQQAT